MKAVAKTQGHSHRDVSQRVSPGGFTVQFSQSCSACNGAAKSARREFSDQAWAALVSWGEIHEAVVDQPVCNDCYFNLRDVLIDRAEDITSASNGPSYSDGRAGARAAIG